MSKVKYTAPEMDIVEFGNEDVCTNSMGWTPDGNPSHGFGVVEEGSNGNNYSDNDF